MPTTLPERVIASYSAANATSLNFLVSMSLVLILAASLSVLMLDRFGLWYVADGQCLVAYPTASELYFP